MEETGPNQAEIYLLTGFFAAGKTTLIRRLLANPHSERYAVIQNEFAEGQMGIEQPLIMDESGTPFESFLELPNGCICCSAKNDLVAAIEFIIAKTAVRKILVETNGLADPVQSIKQFWFDEEALIRAKLHSVIAVVNAKRCLADSLNPLFARQVASATQVVLTFLDQASPTETEEARATVRGLNFECRVVGSSNDLEDVTQLFKGESLFSRESLLGLGAESVQHHKGQIRPVFLKGKSQLGSPLEVEQTVGALLWESGLSIMRIKGAICLSSEPTVFELQGVEDLFQLKPTSTSTQAYGGQSRILVVGEGLSQEQLYGLLKVAKAEQESQKDADQ